MRPFWRPRHPRGTARPTRTRLQFRYVHVYVFGNRKPILISRYLLLWISIVNRVSNGNTRLIDGINKLNNCIKHSSNNINRIIDGLNRQIDETIWLMNGWGHGPSPGAAARGMAAVGPVPGPQPLFSGIVTWINRFMPLITNRSMHLNNRIASLMID